MPNAAANQKLEEAGRLPPEDFRGGVALLTSLYLILIFLAALDHHCGTQNFSSCGMKA